MKQKLLCIALLALGFSVEAQVLTTETFDSYTVGNVCTSTGGAVAGQGGYFNYNGAVTNYQIVSEGGTHDKVLQITGQTGTTPSALFMWKDGLSTLWGTRTNGNNIIEIEIDLYVGATSTSKNAHLIYLYDATATKVLVGLQYLPETRMLSGITYYNNAGTLDNYSFNLAAGGLVLAQNTWHRVGMSYNYTTGQVLWKAPGMAAAGGVTGAATSTTPAEIDFVSVAGTGNTASSVMKWDNLTVKATNTNTLLPAATFELGSSHVTVYPNPTSDVLNLQLNGNISIKSLELVDLNGRIIKSINGFVEKLDISDLNSGIYMLNVVSDTSKEVIKIFKK